jgi:multiple sugar transport system substrate-binding protein
MPASSSSFPRLSRRRALASAVAPLGALALLSACGGTAAATVSTATAPAATTSAPPPATSSAAAVASSSATSLSSATTTSSQVATTSSAAVATSSAAVATSTAAPTAQPAAAAPPRSGNAVVFWSNSGYPYKDQVGAQLVQEFQQQGGPTIAYTDTTYGDFMKKLLTTVAAGTPPDLSYVDRYVTQSYASRGVLSPMDAMIGTSKVIKKDSFFPLLVHDTTYHGKTYGIPHGPDVGLLYYNKDLFHAMGLDPEKPPTDWDTANTLAQQLTRKDGDNYVQVGWSPAQDWGVPWMVAYWQQGGQLLNADETMATFDNAQAVAALDFLKKTYDLEGGYDAVTKFVSGVASGDAEKAFMASKVAMRWDTHSTIHTFAVNKVNFQWGASYFPLPQGGHHANYMGGWSLAIPTGAKQAAGAFQFLEFLCQPDPQVRWAEAWNCVPPVVAVAQSPAYIKGDQVRQLAVNEMPTAQWVIAAPGGDQIITPEVGIMGTVMSGKQSSHDALAAANAQVQTLLTNAIKGSTVQ